MSVLAALSELLTFSVELLGFLAEPFVLWGSSGSPVQALGESDSVQLCQSRPRLAWFTGQSRECSTPRGGGGLGPLRAAPCTPSPVPWAKKPQLSVHPPPLQRSAGCSAPLTSPLGGSLLQSGPVWQGFMGSYAGGDLPKFVIAVENRVFGDSNNISGDQEQDSWIPWLKSLHPWLPPWEQPCHPPLLDVLLGPYGGSCGFWAALTAGTAL